MIKARLCVLRLGSQILVDHRAPAGAQPRHRAAALCDLLPRNEKTHLKPVGEWNGSRVMIRGNHGEAWLNGERIVQFDLGTARMDSAVGASKFRSIQGFATRRKAHIVLQDHGDEVYFRNIKVRDL